MKRRILFFGILLILSMLISDKNQEPRIKTLRELKYLIYLPGDYGKNDSMAQKTLKYQFLLREFTQGDQI
jgi:hypothetical protein